MRSRSVSLSLSLVLTFSPCSPCNLFFLDLSRSHIYLQTKITNSVFISNYDADEGSAIYCVEADMSLSSVLFYDNVADAKGGAVYTDTCLVTVEDTQAYGNAAGLSFCSLSLSVMFSVVSSLALSSLLSLFSQSKAVPSTFVTPTFVSSIAICPTILLSNSADRCTMNSRISSSRTLS
jgi:predicted outer membrane repeat protein